jgi:hypothetical protein
LQTASATTGTPAPDHNQWWPVSSPSESTTTSSQAAAAPSRLSHRRFRSSGTDPLEPINSDQGTARRNRSHWINPANVHRLR